MSIRCFEEGSGGTPPPGLRWGLRKSFNQGTFVEEGVYNPSLHSNAFSMDDTDFLKSRLLTFLKVAF